MCLQYYLLLLVEWFNIPLHDLENVGICILIFLYSLVLYLYPLYVCYMYGLHL